MPEIHVEPQAMPLNIHALMVGEIPRLRRYARFLMRDIRKADDLVQVCLTRAISSLPFWKRGTNIRAWLFVTLHDQYRRDRAACMPETANGNPGRDASPRVVPLDRAQESKQEMAQLQDAFETLPDEHQQVLLMVGMDGLSQEDTAEALGQPVNVIRSRLIEAHAALRRMIQMPLLNGEEETGTNSFLRSSLR